MFITHRPTLTLQLHNFDLFRTCRTSIFCTVAWQLARFQLTRRIARSLGDSWISSCIFADLRANSQWRVPRKKTDIFTCQVGSTDGSFERKPWLKRQASAVRRTSTTSYSRRESFERRFSCEETVCRPHPTPQVFQTDIESRQTHSQCHQPCQLSKVTNAKLSWMKRMRFSFVVRCSISAVGNYSCCTGSTYQQYFWYSGDVCETKEWPKSIPNRNIPVFSEYGFRLAELFSAAAASRNFFRRWRRLRALGQMDGRLTVT